MQPDGLNLWYFNLRLFDLTVLLDWMAKWLGIRQSVVFLIFLVFICLQINTVVEYKWKRSKLYGVYIRQVCTVHKPSMYTVQKPDVYTVRCTTVHKLWFNQEIFCMYTLQTYPEHTPDTVGKPAVVIFFNKNITIYKTALPHSWNQVSHTGLYFNSLS